MKTDIRMHSDNELSLIVFNDESLYINRRKRRFIEDYIEDHFIFTDDQLEILRNDLADDYNEEIEESFSSIGSLK